MTVIPDFLFPPLGKIPPTPNNIATLAYMKAKTLDEDEIYRQTSEARGFDPLSKRINER